MKLKKQQNRGNYFKMAIGAVSKKDRYKLMGLTEEEVEKIKSDVYGILKLVSKSVGVDIPEKDFPKVDIIGGDISMHSRQSGITIAKDKIGNGASYAAEVGHFIRDYATGKLGQEDPSDINESRAHEFFDRVTYRIARERAKGTELEHLFSMPEVDYSSPEGRKKLAEMNVVHRRSIEQLKSKPSNHYQYKETLEATESEAYQARAHITYTYADQYSANELLAVDGLYKLSDKEVERRFFHKRHRGLENTLKISTIIFSIVGIFFLFPGITGNVVNYNSIITNSNVIGVVFLLIALITYFIYLNKKTLF